MSKNENGKSTTNNHGPPRRCHVVKVPDFDGYGFNLHAEKGKPGQYIGKVDDGSPAQVAGLRQGDRIIEVNGVNIGRETHKEVVQRIKAIANEVQLLVVDASVTVSKDNRIVDAVPAVVAVVAEVPAVPAAAAFVPPPPRDTQQITIGGPSSTPDIVVQLPSQPSTPKSSSDSADTVDHHAVHYEQSTARTNGSISSNASSPRHSKEHAHAHNNVVVDNDQIVPITIKAPEIAHHGAIPANVAANTSTFATVPKDYGQTNGSSSGGGSSSKFVSTASFITTEQSDVVESTTRNSVTTTSTATSSSSHQHHQQQQQQQQHQHPKHPTSSITTTTTSSGSSTIIASGGADASPPTSSAVSTVSATSAPSTPPKSPISNNNVTSMSNSSNSSSPHIISNNNNNNHSNQTSPTTSTPPLIAPAAPKPATTASDTNNANNKPSSGLNLNMTVAELRAKLAAKKKFDPKTDAVDLRKKYEIVEKL